METKAVVEQFIAALKRRELASAVDFFTPDARYQEAGMTPIVGREAIGECFGRFVSLDRPWDFRIDSMIISDHESRAAVAYRFVIEGTDGEALERAGCALIALDAGRFREWREYSG